MLATAVEQYFEMVKHLDNADKMILAEKIINSVNQEPKLNKLSKLVAHPNIVNGDSDDLVNVSWEKELNLDFPN